MNNKFVIGILTGAAGSLIAAAILFTVYLAGTPAAVAEGKPQNGSVTASPTQAVQSGTEESKGVLSVTNDEMLEKIEYFKDVINEYSLYGATEDDMLNGVYRGLVWSLEDAYATYYTPEEMADMMESSSGVYCGIGAYVSQNVYTGIITIVKPFKDGPAAKAGILRDDVILMVDDMDVNGMDLNEVVSHMKGKEDTKVDIRVLRGEEELTFTVTRAVVEVPTIEYEMMDGNIGYILISEFDEITVEQFDRAVTDLEKKGMKALVIDLRDNPGGLVDSAVEMLDRLLPKGLMVYTEDKDGKREEEYAKDSKQLKVPLALLINGNSASSSEIFAGAIKDYGKGTIVGEKSFGKGIVQYVLGAPDGSGIKLTVSEYFTPKGNAVHGIGITPDVEEVMDEELATMTEIPKDKDNQLIKAIEVLSGQLKNQTK